MTEEESRLGEVEAREKRSEVRERREWEKVTALLDATASDTLPMEARLPVLGGPQRRRKEAGDERGLQKVAEGGQSRQRKVLRPRRPRCRYPGTEVEEVLPQPRPVVVFG